MHGVLQNGGLTPDIKQGLHVRAEYLLKQPLDPVEPVYLYQVDTPQVSLLYLTCGV